MLEHSDRPSTLVAARAVLLILAVVLILLPFQGSPLPIVTIPLSSSGVFSIEGSAVPIRTVRGMPQYPLRPTSAESRDIHVTPRSSSTYSTRPRVAVLIVDSAAGGPPRYLSSASMTSTPLPRSADTVPLSLSRSPGHPQLPRRVTGTVPSASSKAAASPSHPPAPSPMDVVLFANAAFMPGVAAIVNSVRHSSSLPVRFWIGAEDGPDTVFRLFDCLGINREGIVARNLVPLIKPTLLQANRHRLFGSAANFARFTVLETFPELSESAAAWVLDPDVLPVADLAQALPAFVASGKMLGAVRRSDGLTFAKNNAKGRLHNANYISSTVQSLYKTRYRRTFPLGGQPWNAGAMPVQWLV
jgi:hypothetical protein